jgi:mediator of RNA polymerase II transcription subunit 17
MTQARDILNSLLSSVQTTTINSILSNLQPNPAPVQAAPTNEPALTTTTVNKVLKPSPVTAIQAFDTQIVIGSKDEALRKAASLFDSAATSIEKNQERNEFYWLNALKIRQDNWRLLPAPLPPGSFVGKGGDRTAKDLLISYGLEECE